MKLFIPLIDLVFATFLAMANMQDWQAQADPFGYIGWGVTSGLFNANYLMVVFRILKSVFV